MSTGTGVHSGQVALVTGAASGIGRATAERIAAEGGAVDLAMAVTASTSGNSSLDNSTSRTRPSHSQPERSP